MTASAVGSAAFECDEYPVEIRGMRSLGSSIAAGIGLVAVGIALTLGGGSFFVSGIPAAALSGAFLGPWIRPGRSIAGVATVMAVATVAVAECIVLVALLVEAHVASGPAASADLGSTIVGLAYIGLIGLVVIGVPMLIVTTPCAIAWAFIVRHLVRRGHGVSGA